MKLYTKTTSRIGIAENFKLGHNGEDRNEPSLTQLAEIDPKSFFKHLRKPQMLSGHWLQNNSYRPSLSARAHSAPTEIQTLDPQDCGVKFKSPVPPIRFPFLTLYLTILIIFSAAPRPPVCTASKISLARKSLSASANIEAIVLKGAP